MRKIVTIIGVLLAIIIILALIVPQKMTAERSILINAPKQLIYDHVRYFKNFDTWSPWAALDTAMTVSLEGKDGEVGSKYHWKGNDKVGAGTQEITALKNDTINIQVLFSDFDKPAHTTLQFENVDGATRVTWRFDGGIPIPFNLMGLFYNFSDAIGQDYERGLTQLKEFCESLAISGANMPKEWTVKETTFVGGTYAAIRKVVAFKDIATFFSTNYPIISKEIARAKTTMVGNPCGFFYDYNEEKQQTDMAAAIPTMAEVNGNGISAIKLPKGKALCVDYYGDYAKSAPVYEAIEQYAKDKHLTTTSPATEEYVTDPMMEKDTAKWLTRICFPIAP